MMNNSKDRGPRRERRWQTSQERARVAAELIEEAESLTQTGAIASPRDVARDGQPPPLRIAQRVATPGPMDITARLDDGELEPPARPATPAQAPAPAPPAFSAPPPPALEPTAPALDDPLYIAAREANERADIARAAAADRERRGGDRTHAQAHNILALARDTPRHR